MTQCSESHWQAAAFRTRSTAGTGPRPGPHDCPACVFQTGRVADGRQIDEENRRINFKLVTTNWRSATDSESDSDSDRLLPGSVSQTQHKLR